jgi:hypothetical protein
MLPGTSDALIIAIILNPDRRDHSSTAQLEPMSPPHGKTFIPEIPTHLPELNGDVLRTIFAHLACNGALPLGPCLFVCRNWCDLIYATNMLWSTIIVDEVFYRYFCANHTRFQSTGQFLNTCIERSRPAETRLSWDWEGLARRGCNKFGSPRRVLFYLEKWVTEAVMLNHGEAFKRCSDLTLISEQGSSFLHSVIAGVIDELPSLRKLAIRNYPSQSDALNALLRRSHDTLEKISIEDSMRWTPMKGAAASFPSLQRVSMHYTRAWVPEYLLALGRFLFVRHLSLGSGALAMDENALPDISYYEGEDLPTESINLPHLVSLHVWGYIPFSVLKVLCLPSLAELYVEQDMRGTTSLPQMTRTSTPSQIKRLRVVASSLFAFGSWDGALNGFLELVGTNLESIMIEKWMEERVMEKVLGNLTLKCKIQVLVAP